ncbi:PMS1 protein homolog 1 [Danio rerio]|uniref:PMS1 protein homolog 1 n=1 Tax=Danio rerio TaxID=7955 RepID=Q8JFR9_DANRE|nr:PMS1 protein homolog 1 [Danio rerio]CAD43440.1 SI:dZ72B14.2 (novel protein similar to human postmeiotic segregation increased 1-like protein (PMSL1)) [Danio rerio]|eukprot:NP_958476.2 PMS1 protein homolog 1 [Danio rerio]
MKALPPETVRLLCSSQVITSVLNVVKELIENSLDAGSSSLEVKLENYGLDRIEVRDNGSGIKATDVSVMAVKHYTSKISCHEDLEQLETYGFRGEALASICAISEVIITTKTADDDFSIQYSVDHNGQIVSQKPSHLGQGTTVCAANLFKNLPVRRQYYSNTKKCKDELKRVQNLLMAYAVIKPELRVTLSHNKAVVWQKSRVSDHRTALMAVLGAASVANMLPVQHHQEQPEITIDGFFPKPGSDLNSTSSSTTDKSFIFVNSRPVHHKEILKLIKQYYTSAQSNSESVSRRYPTFMMNITIPASTVDVNLTPDKTEVMLQNKDEVLLSVETMLISLYGYSNGEENLKTAGNPPDVTSLDEPKRTSPDISLKHPELPEDSSSNAEKQDGELSLSNTANTSSSSISEDWVINRSDLDSINCSVPVDDVVMNSTADLNSNSPKASESDSGPESQISAENWSAGRVFSNQITGEYLEPVKLHIPKAIEDLGGTEAKSVKSSPSKKPSNVIVEKMAKLTAYELISNRSVRQPSSAFSLFEQDTRSQVLQENPKASPQDVTAAAKERWESLGEEDRKKYEGKAEKSLNAYNLQRKRAAEGGVQCGEGKKQMSAESPLNKAQGVKRKAPLANQQALDKLFSSQPSSKRSPAKISKPLPFTIATLKQSLNLLSEQSSSSVQGLRLVNRLASHGAWVVLCGRKLMLLNPFRVEEALLFKRLLEDNILPTVRLQTPVLLTDGVLGGPEYMDVLLNMKKDGPEFNGDISLTDPRLVANGFEIRMISGPQSSERHVEVMGMADCMPFFGIGDLREILQAIKARGAKTVAQCRPRKVSHYLESEAVRLARQLPLSLSRADVTNTLCRMQQELQDESQVCIHRLPFFHNLVTLPETELEALQIMSGSQ